MTKKKVVVRNPQATCLNCPFWDELTAETMATAKVAPPIGKDGKPLRLGECRRRIPDVAVHPVQVGPTVANPERAGVMWKISRPSFNPTETYWCGDHPFFFMEVEVEEQ